LKIFNPSIQTNDNHQSTINNHQSKGGRQDMRAEQISVFLENKAGRLAEVAAILAEADVNIRALALADTSDFGVLRLIVNDNQKAIQALKNRGFTVSKTDVVAVEVEDRPGELFKILDMLAGEGINIDYVYVIAGTKIVLSVADVGAVEKVLLKNNIKLCG